LLVVALSTADALASKGIFTTNSTATVVDQNIYAVSTDVYLSGGPQNTSHAGLADGTYYFQVTDPSGKTLLSTDNAVCRQLNVVNGVVVGATGPCPHKNGTFNPADGVTPVQLAPYSVTPNKGNEYKAWMIPKSSATISGTDPKVLIFQQSSASTDNFKIQASGPPPATAARLLPAVEFLVGAGPGHKRHLLRSQGPLEFWWSDWRIGRQRGGHCRHTHSHSDRQRD
jgi:hypothetical protein